MAEFDVETLSLKELKSLQKDLARAIFTFEDRQKSDARSKLEIIAKEMGYSLAELIGTDAKAHPSTRRREVPPSRKCGRHLVRPGAQAAVVCRSPRSRQIARGHGSQLTACA